MMPSPVRTIMISMSPITLLGDAEDITRFRNSMPKVKTGCITCKIRRVKCDEAKPNCKRCISTGRKCDGYIAPTTKIKHTKTRMQRRPLPSVIPHSPSVEVEGSYGERRGFHYFRSRNMAEMPGNFEPYFWDHLVLQLSHRDPTVRNALVALSFIYEEHELSRQDPTHVWTGQLRSPIVLQQYTKAVGLLAHGLSTGQTDLRVTLASCLIFIWIELLQNNLDLGFKHLESGLQILQSIKQSRQPDGSQILFQNDFEDIYGSLDRSFKRLTIQALLHGRTTSNFNPITKPAPWETEIAVPRTFTTVFQARNCLDNLLDYIFASMRYVRNSGQIGHSLDLLELDNTCQLLLNHLQQWEEASHGLAESQSATDSNEPFSQTLYLQLYHTMMSVMLKTPFATCEMIFDRYTAEFEHMLVLSETLLNRPASSQPPVLSLDMGVIPPLFFLVAKCRDIRLRQRAVTVLKKAPDQEGMWRRACVVAFAEWKIEMEEQARGQLPESTVLPESGRIYQETATFKIIEGTKVPVVKFRRGGIDPAEPPEEVEIKDGMRIFEAMGNIL